MQKKNQVRLVYVLLAIAIAIAFSRVSHCGFITYDDPDYVTDNIHVQHGLTAADVGWAFTVGYASNWHPLTWISHMLDVQLFGLDPHSHHLVNLLFHILNTLLLFFILNRMTGSTWKSAFTAALFGLHPLHVESVAWVSERKDVLSTFFWMLTAAAYVLYVENRRRPERGVPFADYRYLAALVLFLLGLMAKPMLVTLPMALLLMDFWPLKRLSHAVETPGEANVAEPTGKASIQETAEKANGKIKKKAGKKPSPSLAPVPALEPGDATREAVFKLHPIQWPVLKSLVIEKIPFFILAALSCIVTVVAQEKGGAVRSIQEFTPIVRISNALVSYVLYLKKTVFPVDLCIFYPHPVSWDPTRVLGAFLVLALVTFVVLRAREKHPYLAFGWLWFALTLLPVIGIVQVGLQGMADRYTYVPYIGLFVMATWGTADAAAKWRAPREARIICAALVLALLSAVTWNQLHYWRDSLSLYDRALEVTKNNYIIHYNRGEVLQHRGKLRQALADYDTAIEIYPKYAKAYNNRGVVHRGLGDNEKAISDYNKAIESNPRLVEAFINRGNIYALLGSYNLAIEDYGRALEMDPGKEEAYHNRGVVYEKLGEYGKAIADLDKYVELNPRDANAIYQRGIVYLKISRADRGIEDLKSAARLGDKNAGNLLKDRGVSW